MVPYVQTNTKCKLAASVQKLPEFFSGRYKSYSVNSLLPALCFVLKSSWREGSGPYLIFITYTLCTEQKLYLTSAKASPGSVYLLFCDSDLKIKTTPNWRTKLFSVKSTQILQLLWHLTRKSNCTSTLSVVFVFLFSGWNLDRVLLNWKSIKTKKRPQKWLCSRPNRSW